MAHQSDLIAEDILAYLKSQEEKSLLRFITCGSVDDGKSTLIGRLLWDSKLIFEDQLAALEADSKRVGTQGEQIDYALLLDGLQAEREQGITIDVAYRFFSTDKRKFIVADTPGHEQYTRNMVTGASTAQVAVILIDARKGILTQTRRHSYLASLVGIRNVVLAINKMDLVDYSAERFAAILKEYEIFAAALGFDQVVPIPISALNGDNVLERSGHTPWYQGPTLMEHLETVPVAADEARKPLRLSVQWVNRPNLDFRGFCGTIASGRIRPGDAIVVAASGQRSRIARIVTLGGDLPQAVAGEAVTVTLEDEIDISRGDTLTDPGERPCHADRFEAKLVWMHDEPLQPGASYLLKTGAATTPAQVSELKFKVNVNTLEQEAGSTLALNEVGVCSFNLSKPMTFDSYRENRATGSFILIDRLSNATVAAGMIHQPLLQPGTSYWATVTVAQEARAELKGQRPRVLWLTTHSETQRVTLAGLVEKRLHSLGRHTFLLDGEELAQGLNGNLPPGPAGSDEPLRRAAEVAKILVEAGLIVVATVPAPSRRERKFVRELLKPGEFVEVFLSSQALEEASAGTPDRASDFEAPAHPEITVAGNSASAEELAEQIVRELLG